MSIHGKFESELEKPPDKEIICKWCQKKMWVTHHWISVLHHWMHPGVHEHCQDAYNKQRKAQSGPAMEREIPERFTSFDPRLANQEALAVTQGFMPDSRLKTLVLVGVPGRGKSRIMWATITQFFDLLELEAGAKRWPEYYLFSDLVSELDKQRLNRLKLAKHAFLDDVGSVESYGRERAALQQVIRARIQKGDNWTFLTIDSLSFDPGLEDLFKGRAIVHYMDK